MTRCDGVGGDDDGAPGCYRVRRVIFVPVQRDFPPRPVKPGLHLGHVVVEVVVVGRQHPEHQRGKVTAASPSTVRVIQWMPL